MTLQVCMLLLLSSIKALNLNLQKIRPRSAKITDYIKQEELHRAKNDDDH